MTLFDAIAENNIDECERLLQTGADINTPDENGWMPLYLISCVLCCQLYLSDGEYSAALIAQSILRAIFLSDQDVFKPDYLQKISGYPNFTKMSDMWDAEQKVVEQEHATLQACSFKNAKGSFSLLDLYTEKDENTLAKMSRNKALHDKFKEIDQGRFKALFYFKRGIDANFQRGLERAEMLDHAVQIFSSADQPLPLPRECWEKIFSNFSTKNMASLFRPQPVALDNNTDSVWTPSNSPLSI